MIKVNEAKEVLINMLIESGFDFNNPNSELAWIVFKKFFSIKVDCTDDALLFQCGVYNFTGEDLFHFEFVRQFIFEIDKDYDHMEQLRLTIYFKPKKELQELKTNLWSYDCSSIDEFFEKIRCFELSIDKCVPLKAEVEHEKV